MGKVWVVTQNSWNGEHDAVSVSKVFSNQENADAYVKTQEAIWAPGSCYCPTYEVEEFEVE